MRDDDRSLRSTGYWRGVARTMLAVATVRLAVRLLLIVVVGLILLTVTWFGS